MVPDWERNIQFDPENAVTQRRDSPLWTDGVRGFTRAEEVLVSSVEVDVGDIPRRRDDAFVPGQLRLCLSEWKDILKGYPFEEDVLKWIKNGVDVHDFFQCFKGEFKGKFYDSDVPPVFWAPNAKNCRDFGKFIADTLEEGLRNQTFDLLGKIGNCVLPKVIMPLTVEPNKPRLCHDERFINCWIKDCPFKLDTLKDVPRLIEEDSYCANMDDKAGYQHVLMSKVGKTYFGFAFGGWAFGCNTLPFGWKASPFVYQTIGMAVTSYLRSLGVRNLQYIDDRLLVGRDESDTKRKVYAMLEIVTRLGYTISFSKSMLVPAKRVQWLGMIIMCDKMSFGIPPKKKEKFITLRESMLQKAAVSVQTLQRFTGKCISLSLAVPGARMNIRAVNASISKLLRFGGQAKMSGPMKREIMEWRTIDDLDGQAKWREERHLTFQMSTDASQSGFGAVGPCGELIVRDYWQENDRRPIHLKEAEALLKGLLSVSEEIRDHRVVVNVDNKAVIAAWDKGCKNVPLNEIMKSIFKLTLAYNVELRLRFVPSDDNLADVSSRFISMMDVKLSPRAWETIQIKYGPHDCDLMALDNNAMMDFKGKVLEHFTPTKTPFSSGVDLFAQDLTRFSNPYVFPPLVLIPAVLAYLKEQNVSVCTVVVPELEVKPAWWPEILVRSKTNFILGIKGQKDMMLIPSEKGYISDSRGLQYTLRVFRVYSKNINRVV